MPRPARRPRVIGPFFMAAILLSLGVFAWQRQRHDMALQTQPPPIVEHQVIGGAETENMPSPELVSSSAEDLGLTPGQLRRIAPLTEAYLAELKPLQAQSEAAARRFRMDREGDAGRRQVPVAEIGAQAAAVNEVSSRMVALRRQYWRRIEPILTSRQRTQARELWDRRLAPAKGRESR